MATDGELNDLLADLRSEGEVDSKGRFTLDKVQARAKLQKFQLADARRYVLELVQAAVLRGATTIDFDIDADDMRMRFDGRVFTAAELDDLWGSIFADGDDADLRGVRQLALGLNAALGTKPKRIVVRSGATQVRLLPGGDAQTTDEHTPIDPPIAETTIHVKQRVKLVLIVEFLRNLTGLLDEEVYLRNRCAHAPIPITLDGEPIVLGLRVADAIVSHAIRTGGVEGVLGWVESDRPAELRLIKDGVWIDSRPLERCGPGIVALVAGEQLRKDVSLAKIVADDALAQIVGLVRVERWGLCARTVEQVERGERSAEPKLSRVRAEAMNFLKLRDIRKRPDAAIVARAIGFTDARVLDPQGRGDRRSISLATLADVIEAQTGEPKLGYATREYSLLSPEEPPIPRLDDEQAKALARMFGCAMRKLDDELAEASKREQARLVWLSRTMDPVLPDFRRYLFRQPLAGSGLRGELGLGVDAIDGSRTDGTLWLLHRGCLLGKLELAWGIAALDVVVEAEFEPGALYDDVIRNRELARVCFVVLANLGAPLAAWVEASRGESVEASGRALVKGWLTLVLHPDARTLLLWNRLGVSASELDDRLDAILPTAEQLRTGAAPFERASEWPLFEDFDGRRRSIRELVERHERAGALDWLDRDVFQVPGLGEEVAWLGPGDRQILIGLFGEARLRSWLPSLQAKLREQEFWAKPTQSFDALAQALGAQLQTAGVDPDLWCRQVEAEDVVALIMLSPGVRLGSKAVDPKLLRRGTIELIHEGRVLTTRVLELGIGPILGFASSKALRINADWNDVEDDAALLALTEQLRAAAWSLVAGLVQRFAELHGKGRWLARLLLHRLAQADGQQVATRLPELRTLPLLATLDGGTLSVIEVEAVIAEHKQIEWVAQDTPGAGIRNPPMLREEAGLLDALRSLVGADKLVEGTDRLRRVGLEARLESMPKVDRVELEPRTVWSPVPLGQPARAGEIGLSRERTSGGLALELCTLGRRVGAFMHDELPVALEAIAEDPELPLLADGQVDTRSKRYGQLLRRCRRAIPGLILSMCKRYEGLTRADQAQVRALLLGYAQAEALAGPGRRESRESAWEAVRALPLIVDVWGQWYSLAKIEARSKRRGEVDVVSKQVEVDGESAKLDRLVLIVDEPARKCLLTMVKLREVEGRWEHERAALRELANAPQFELPDLREHAWIDRKATVAGGLEAHLWIPRTPSDDDQLVFVRGDKRVGAMRVIPGVGCAGVVRGDGLVVGARGVELDAKQRNSLAKQICVLCSALAKQVKSGGRLGANEREQALAWLVGVDGALAQPIAGLEGVGKPLVQLREALAEIISPALRRAMARARAPVEPEPSKPEPSKPEPSKPEPEPSKPEPSKVEPEPSKVEPELVVMDAGGVLLTLVRAELEWARTRHGALLDRLGLDRLTLGGGKPGIAVFDRGIVLQREHAVVARLLGALRRGDEVDPIDLAFLVSGVFTVMNAVAVEIDEDDERAFVGYMALTLSLALSG